MATLKLEIVTPEEKIYSEDVEMVTLPGSEGELGVYPKHVPLLTTLKPGELRVVKSGRETTMAIGEGFVEIKGDAVSVLTDMALESEKIDIATAEAAVERAKAAMKEDHSAEEVAAIQASLQKALAQLHVKRRRHGYDFWGAHAPRVLAMAPSPFVELCSATRLSMRARQRPWELSPATAFTRDCSPMERAEPALKKSSLPLSRMRRIRHSSNTWS